MLASETKKYVRSDLMSGDEAQRKTYFPDNVIDAFVNEVHTLHDSLKTPQIIATTTPRFTPEQSRDLVLAALNEFDPILGRQATEIFAAGFDKAVANSRMPGFKIDWNKDADVIKNGSRWRMEQVPAGEARIMSSLPAGQPRSWMGPANPNDYSIINYQFDGTIDAAIHIAHEVGHSIADDYQREHGGADHKYSDNPEHMIETQAYLTQHIFYDYVMRHPELEQTYPGIGQATRQHFNNTMLDNISVLSATAASDSDRDVERLHCRPMGILSALAIFNLAQTKNEPDRQWISETLLGRHGPKKIQEVLAKAGIENTLAMTELAKDTVKASMKYSGIQIPEPSLKDEGIALYTTALSQLKPVLPLKPTEIISNRKHDIC